MLHNANLQIWARENVIKRERRNNEPIKSVRFDISYFVDVNHIMSHDSCDAINDVFYVNLMTFLSFISPL
jgi:hypothetical protein